MKQPGLRFAPLIRVSTEKQEKQGESLATQKTDLEKDIKSMGGSIFKWYAGQEHATPDFERIILDQLIADAEQHKFDAVIIWSLDRWSRDDLRGPQDLKVLKDNGIRFFERTREHDLHDENQYFMIALYGLMGRTQALATTRKSILNRIHRAKQGFPTGGALPFGRTYTKKNGWGIDPVKQKIIQDAAKRYLRGEGLADIALRHKMDKTTLAVSLKKRSGDTWEQRFTSKKLGIDETVQTKIPRLLSKATIAQILERSESNKTYTHGLAKNSYLLSRMIFCEACGFAIAGHPAPDGTLYYRHARHGDCKTFNSVRADLIERHVIDDIFRMLGDRPAMEAAAKAAIPNLAELEELKTGIEEAEKELVRIKKGKGRFIDGLAEGTIAKEDIKEGMIRLKEREALLLAEIDIAKVKCATIPTKEEVNRKSTLLLRLMEGILKGQKHLSEMPFDEKRKLLQYAFGGKDASGKRLGVYIGKDPNGNWIYTIRGAFTDSKGIRREIDILDVASKDDSNPLESLDKNIERRYSLS